MRAAAAPTNGRGQPIYRRSTSGSRPKECFIARDAASGHVSWDATNRVGPFRQAGVTRPDLSQSSECTSRPGPSAEGLMPKAARERLARPRAGTALAPHDGMPPPHVRPGEFDPVCNGTSDEAQVLVTDNRTRRFHARGRRFIVMPGLEPGIHVLSAVESQRRGWPRDKPSHDEKQAQQYPPTRMPGTSPGMTETGCADLGWMPSTRPGMTMRNSFKPGV